jgi:hypothetical protein
MRRGLIALVCSLGLGCAGKNTVAGLEKTKAEQLEANLPSWCEATCSRLGACSSQNGCDCEGDVCSCAGVGDDCAANCQEEMRRFSVDEECAEAGQSVQSCFDALTCDEFDSKSCQFTEADQKRCPELNDGGDDGPTPSGNVDEPASGTAGTAPSGTGGGPSSGGASSGSAGTSGSGASGGTGSGGVAVRCSGGYGTAGGSAGGGTPSTEVTCEEGYEGCDDDHAYSWLCVRGSQGQVGCTCFVDSQVTGGFDPESSSCPVLAVVNSGCGWNLSP